MELNTQNDYLLLSGYLRESNILQLLPDGVYVCNASGTIIYYNDKAVDLWGRSPQSGDTEEHFYSSFRLYYPDNTKLPRKETPFGRPLVDGLPRQDVRLILERPDLSRITVKLNSVPLKGSEENIVGTINTFTDITAENETQLELDRKNRELQDFVENSAIALHRVDANGYIQWANAAELNMFGYTAEEYIGQHISRFHVDKDKITDILHRLSCSETLDQYESHIRCKDGSIKTVRISSNVYREDGRFIHTRCFTLDVTEQKKLFEALYLSESRYRKLVDSVDLPIYTTDGEGKITLYNQAAVELWGRDPEPGERWSGSWKTFRDDGSELPGHQCPMAVCLREQRPVDGELIRIMRPDGSYRTVVPKPLPFFDESGELAGAINILIDITASKIIENDLRKSEGELRTLAAVLEKRVAEKTADLTKQHEVVKRSEERYHKMIEEVEDYAIILLDNEGNIQNWNKGAEKIKGYREEEIVGKNFSVFYLPEDKQNMLPQKLLKEASGHGKALYEGWRRRKDGSTFWGSIVLTALHNDRHELIGFSKVTRDLTQKKLAEDRIKEYTNQLEFQNRELAQFAFAASHDLKEPLRKIHFYNSAIIHDNADVLNEKSLIYLNRSVGAAKRMMSLIEDLLNYSRTTSTQENLEKVNLNEVVEAVVQMHKEDIDEYSIHLDKDDLPLINGIPFQLRQLIDNLLMNAIKYKHPDRTLHIRIKAEKVTGAPSLQGDGKAANGDRKYFKISLIDNGKGFEQQYAEKIFDIFQRLNNDPAAKGSGIGLSICKRIMQNHHGYITAEGKPDEGAQFDLYFPKSYDN